MQAIWRVAVMVVSATALSGCGLWRPTTVPMVQSFYRAPCVPVDGNTQPLLILLPGRFMQPDEFIREGYLQAVREQGMALDVLIVDAHLGYYSDRSILERLRVDVIDPARKRGAKEIWLAGISIGAFGAILYADAHPGELAGVIAIGPYLGDTTGDDVGAAGGLSQWRAPSTLPPLGVDSSNADAELHVWHWLQGQSRSHSHRYPPLFLGFGRDDRYHDAQRLLADALPTQRVVAVDGDHDWTAWRPVWRQMLSRLPIERRTACKVSTKGDE